MKTSPLILTLLMAGAGLSPVQAQDAFGSSNSQAEPWTLIAKKGGRDDRYDDDDDDHHRDEHRYREDRGRYSAYPSPSASPGHTPRSSPGARPTASPWPSPGARPTSTGWPSPGSRGIPRNDRPNFKEQLYRQRQEMREQSRPLSVDDANTGQ